MVGIPGIAADRLTVFTDPQADLDNDCACLPGRDHPGFFGLSPGLF